MRFSKPKKSNRELEAELKRAKAQREEQDKRIKLKEQLAAEKRKIKANKRKLQGEGFTGSAKREISKLVKDAKKLNKDYQKWAGGGTKKRKKKDDVIDF